MNNPKAVKAALRVEAKAKRAAAHAANPDPDVEEIVDTVIALVNLLGGPYEEDHLIATYLSVGDEFPTTRLNALILERKQALCVPAWDAKAKQYVWAYLDGPLIEGPHGIPQPAEIFPVRKPEHIELVLVPGLAFSPEGARLGHSRRPMLRSADCALHSLGRPRCLPAHYRHRGTHPRRRISGGVTP